jgi:uracil phosphoribosyltransferase
MVAFKKVVLVKAHIDVVVPVITAGNGLMVTVVNTIPQVTAYEIVAVPADTPATSPVVAFTVATPVLSLVHNPPETALVSVVVVPGQALKLPPITEGNGSVVKVVVVKQPVGSV